MFVQVPGTSYVRDTDSMGLVNKDASGLHEYQNKRKAMEAQRAEINKIKSDVDGIKSELSDIKQLLLQIVDKGSNV